MLGLYNRYGYMVTHTTVSERSRFNSSHVEYLDYSEIALFSKFLQRAVVNMNLTILNIFPLLLQILL